ncbi:MAG: 2'-5' RNA ligase family protein, partial [Candidatus Nanohaloarchaea archaeon]
FQPHVTLARVKEVTPGKKKKLQKSIEEFSDHSFGELEIDSVKLFRSRLTGQGSRYEELHEAKL